MKEILNILSAAMSISHANTDLIDTIAQHISATHDISRCIDIFRDQILVPLLYGENIDFRGKGSRLLKRELREKVEQLEWFSQLQEGADNYIWGNFESGDYDKSFNTYRKHWGYGQIGWYLEGLSRNKPLRFLPHLIETLALLSEIEVVDNPVDTLLVLGELPIPSSLRR